MSFISKNQRVTKLKSQISESYVNTISLASFIVTHNLKGILFCDGTPFLVYKTGVANLLSKKLLLDTTYGYQLQIGGICICE